MSKNNQIDLIEFPANSAEELKLVTKFLNSVFGWNFKEWGAEYSDSHDSGVTAGVNATLDKEQTMPLTVVYSENLEDTKSKVIKAGGKVMHDISAFPGGRRFVFTDPAGNQLAVWSDE